MLKLSSVGSNMMEVETEAARVLFSCEAPVAAWIAGKPYRTEQYWSLTTSRHIYKWFEGDVSMAEKKPQAFFDGLLGDSI